MQKFPQIFLIYSERGEVELEEEKEGEEEEEEKGGGGREGGGGEGREGEERGWNRLGMETLETFLGL